MDMGEVLSNGAISTSGSFYMVLSSSAPCPAGIPQGARLRHFPNSIQLIHTNDLEDMLKNNNPTNTHKYADDCTIDEVFAKGALSNIRESKNQVMNLANDNKMVVNKTKKIKRKQRTCSGSVFPNLLLNLHPYKQTEIKQKG